MRILVVDDNTDIACSIIDYLEYQGHCVDYARNGNSMLARVSEQCYDVILLDVMMPGQSGFECCRTLRESEACDTPVLFLTARDTLDDKLEGFRVGGDD